MKKPGTYSIAVENRDIVIRLNSELVDQDTLAKLLDYIELESIRKRSALTRAQASALADKINRDVWESSKQKYVQKQVAFKDTRRSPGASPGPRER